MPRYKEELMTLPHIMYIKVSNYTQRSFIVCFFFGRYVGLVRFISFGFLNLKLKLIKRKHTFYIVPHNVRNVNVFFMVNTFLKVAERQ